MGDPLLPWHEPLWQRLRSQIDSGKFPHALMVCGPVDAGKHRLVDQLAGYLLCQGESPACGQCSQCQLLAAGTHPDLLIVSPEESKQIRVDQVRDLIEWAVQTSQQGGRKFCVIEPADCMNIQSANALLKVLEEPPAETVLCLVTAEPSKLLPTLRSRCQRVDVDLPARAVARDWLGTMSSRDDVDLLLDIADGNPVRAAETIDEDYLALRKTVAGLLAGLTDGEISPLQAAADLGRENPGTALEVIYQLVADSIRATQTNGAILRNTDLEPELAKLSQQDLEARYSLLERVASARGQLSGTANPNPQMLVEWVLMG